MATRIDSRSPVATTRFSREQLAPQSTQNRQTVGDSFETPKKTAVVLTPPETAAQERARRVGELHRILDQVKNANPPLSEEQISTLLGSQGDNKYEIRNSQLDKGTMQGLFDLMRGIHQLGRARIALAAGETDVAKTLLDMDPTDEHPGVITYRDRAIYNGLTSAEVGPLALANIDVTQAAFGALSVEQQQANADAQKTLAAGNEVSQYFLSKNKVMSQGGAVQTACEYVVKYSQQLERALAMPLTDGNRATEVALAKQNLDQYLRFLGVDPVKSLEAGRRNTIDTLNNIGDVVSQVPTPITRGAGVLFRTAANGLEYAAGDIDGKQLAWKQAAAIIDAAGGQLTQKLRGAGKIVADAGFEFQKSLAAELGKIDKNLPPDEQARQGRIAIRTALHNSVTGALTDFMGGAFGDAGKKFSAELVRAAVMAGGGALSTAANEINKTLYDTSLTPEQKSAQIREAVWKGVTNAVKSSSEGLLEAVK